MKRTSDVWINAVLFQVVWFAAVAGAARGAWWAGPLAVCVFAGYQLRASRQPRNDLVLVALAIAVGFCADTLFARTQLVIYAAPLPSEAFAPVWILALWANLALTLNSSLAFLKDKLWISAVFGAIGAPLSYFFAGYTWHAVALGDPLPRTLAALAATWAVVTPLLVFAAIRLERRHAPAAIVGVGS